MTKHKGGQGSDYQGRGGKGMNKNNRNEKQEVSPEARRKQIIVGLVMGAIMGVVISWITGFWYWLPAGLALGLATGAIMKPPQT